MLTAAELSAMRDVEESVMPGTAYIVRNTPTADGMGGYSESWGTVGTVACDLWPINNRGDREGVEDGAQIMTIADWYITIPFDTDVTSADRITTEGRTFEVVFVPNDRSYNTALRVEAKSYNESLRN